MWYRYRCDDALHYETAEKVLAIPGVSLRGRVVHVEANAAWLVEDILNAGEVKFEVDRPIEPEPIKSIHDLVPNGLQPWVPDFLTDYQREGVINLSNKNGYFIWAAGCLAGDTEVTVNRGGNSERMDIRNLVYKFNGGVSKNPRNGVETVWDSTIPTYTQSFDERSGVLVKNRILAAVSSGVKQTFRLETSSGEAIRATGEHRFLTPTGWVKLSDLGVGDEVLVETWPKKSSKQYPKFQYAQTDNMWNHPLAVRSTYARTDRPNGIRRSARVATHRLIAEAKLNNIDLATFVGRIVLGETGGLKFLARDQHVHHVDGNPKNNSVENLVILTDEAHHDLHAQAGGWKRVAGKASPSRITSIEPAREEETFDLSMSDPLNNFVANGIVVHNSGKSLGSICWAMVHPRKTLVVTRAPVRRSFGREIERFTNKRAFVVEGTTPIDFTQLAEEFMFVVVSHQILPDHYKEIVRWRPHNLILDELHHLSSHKRWTGTVQQDGKTKFSQLDNIASAAMEISRVASRRLGLSATPVRNIVKNLWAQLDLIEPMAWGPYYKQDRSSFAGRYCDAHPGLYGGIDDKGAKNLDELWDRVSIISDQVSYATTHRGLPPKRRLVTFVPVADQVRATGFQKDFKAAAKAGGTAILEMKLMEAAARKRKYLLDILSDAIDTKQKVVVFTGRRADCEKLGEDVKALMEKLNPGGLVLTGHGGTPSADRDRMQQEYMATPGPAILVGTGDAWGECLDIDTMILGANKPLKECVDGDRVFGEAGVEASQSATIHPYQGQMVEIRAQGLLPMRSTTGHATLTIAGGVTRGRDRKFEFRGPPKWKNSEFVNPWTPNPARPYEATGDFLLVPRLPGKFSDVRFDLNQYVVDPHSRNAKGCPQHLELNESTAWVLGLYAAEGSATVQEDGKVRVTFSLSAKETDLAQRVVDTLAASGFPATVRQQKTWLHVEAKSTPLGRLFRDILGVGAENKKIPDEILLHTDMKILRAFIDGYAAGDGSESDGGRKVQAFTRSKVLALHLQLALARFGRLAGVIPWQPKNGHIDGREIRSNPGFIITWRWETKRHDRFKVLEKYIATPVTEVSIEDYSGPVGYMTTRDHTMLASNAVVHNGVNLQDSDLHLIAMLPYTPGQVIQWEGRCARLGQKRPVMIQYLIAEGTVDEHVADILIRKLPAVEDMVGDESVEGFAGQLAGSDHEDDILDSIMGLMSSKDVGEDD